MICFLRARKDAMRDCLSAMEALTQHLTNTADIDNTDIVKRKNLKSGGKRLSLGRETFYGICFIISIGILDMVILILVKRAMMKRFILH